MGLEGLRQTALASVTVWYTKCPLDGLEAVKSRASRLKLCHQVNSVLPLVNLLA